MAEEAAIVAAMVGEAAIVGEAVTVGEAAIVAVVEEDEDSFCLTFF
jgi:hypothetical protein